MQKRRSRSTGYREADLLLADEQFCRNADDLVAAASSLVDRLPKTAHVLQRVLSQDSHRLSAEVQFSTLVCLNFSTIAPPNIKLLLPHVTEMIMNIASKKAFVWMELGCVLGGAWIQTADPVLRENIANILLARVKTARFVWGRMSALHGIEHAMNTVNLREGKKFLKVVRQVALSDRSLSVRRSAYFILSEGYWWGNGGLTELHTYAERLGKSLEHPR